MTDAGMDAAPSRAPSSTAPRTITWLLLVAVFLIGLAHIAFLPPFEGYDETAHWSYVQELSDLGHGPRYGIDRLSGDLKTYPGPMTYGQTPPFEQTGRATYRSFRLAGAPAIVSGPTRYTSAGDLNWQAQHPPLYYALMVPIYRAAHGLGWVNSLMILRLASWVLAFAGFALGVLSTVHGAGRQSLSLLAKEGWKDGAPHAPGSWIGVIMAAWPFAFPEFFPEFARLGNDSLCILLVAASWALVLRLLGGRGGWASAAGLGVALGLGLLTKAFFVAIGGGIGALLVLRWWNDRRTGVLLQAVLAGVIALAIGAFWYLAKLHETGSLIGSDEFIRLNQSGGAARIAVGFDPGLLMRGIAALPATFAWAGTWSLARLPEILLLPPVLILLLTLVEWGRALPFPLKTPEALSHRTIIVWAPAFFAAPMLVGLIYHVFVWMAGAGAVTPGWYLHILAAPLGFVVALGWRHARVMFGLLVLTVFYTVAAWAFQLSMFSGEAAKLGGDKHYSLTGASRFIDGRTLSALGHPVLGAICLIIGALTALSAAALVLRAWHGQERVEMTELSPLQPL